MCVSPSLEELALSKINNMIRCDNVHTCNDLLNYLLTLPHFGVSTSQREDFSNWHDFDSSEENFCEVDGNLL